MRRTPWSASNVGGGIQYVAIIRNGESLSTEGRQKKPTMPVAECFYFTSNLGVSLQDQITENWELKHRTGQLHSSWRNYWFYYSRKSRVNFSAPIYFARWLRYAWRPLVLNSDPKSENTQGQHSDNCENIFIDVFQFPIVAVGVFCERWASIRNGFSVRKY